MNAASDTTTNRSIPWIVVYVTMVVAVVTNGMTTSEPAGVIGEISSTQSVESQVQQAYFQPRLKRDLRDDI